MIAELECVVLDCPDPMELATFYQSLLGGAVNQPDRRWSLDDDWATLHAPSGLVIAFQRAVDYQPPQWPDPLRPQQFHLDFGVPDLDRAHEQVLSWGATVLDEGPAGRSWRIYADPASHPFCLVRKKKPPTDGRSDSPPWS
ncbi:VOC family protein [Acrocarpospora macrocephala]|uniref:Glyoxalase n=1 Tax=Acrocarpospora macrocephala TaxID=150177 RepID=A0A5M3WV00_9ACTN|nr:VOC family protein [Acrocarpospora macrocephala]GES12714.1 glyoxalase [Acrocarpospora macrocephala]